MFYELNEKTCLQADIDYKKNKMIFFNFRGNNVKQSTDLIKCMSTTSIKLNLITAKPWQSLRREFSFAARRDLVKVIQRQHAFCGRRAANALARSNITTLKRRD